MPLIDEPKMVAVIAGAGPAGLTAALELLRRSNIQPIVLEAGEQVGGISKTVNFRGNRMDLGGHRFFSKSEWVMRWWQEILPIAHAKEGGSLHIHYQGQSRMIAATEGQPVSADSVMLVRRRLSRIFHRRRFFDYPLTLSMAMLRNLGFFEALRIGVSYVRAQVIPRRPEMTLADFLINRFGHRLYLTFFKDYTEKVWGVPCDEISAEWGAQRIKGLSIAKAVFHALSRGRRCSNRAVQRHTETSLIERFLYPKLGPGQMWEEVARRVEKLGGRIQMRSRLVGIEHDGSAISAVSVLNDKTGVVQRIPCAHLVSSIPVAELITYLQPEDPQIQKIARDLPYRDFITVGLLLHRMNPTDGASVINGMPPDNWIYIQEPDVKIGRLQIFNNWSPSLVADPSTIWLGLEYFCHEDDPLWSMQNDRLIDFAAAELEKIGLISRKDVIDGTVVRVPKAYPAYFGAYREFGKIRAYLEQFVNLHPVGRNGMHRYNNQDHSMLAAKGAVDSIINGGSGKSDVWSINAEDEYHEELGELS